jgi:D-alanine-D-alanine ligase
MKISVLFGGWSNEREISIKSAESVLRELKQMGHEVYGIDVRKDLKYISDELYKSSPEFIFNMLHGTGGEDGIIQGVLDVFGVPYSNSGVLSSSVAFHKPTCKKLVKAAGVRVIDGIEIQSENLATLDSSNFAYPFIVKPASNGSSIGVYLIANDDDLQELKNTEWTYGNEIMIEKYIEGIEITTLVIDGKAIGSLEITHKGKIFDYSSKYDTGGSQHIPALEIGDVALAEISVMSELAFNACKCSGIARLDFRFDGKHSYFLEINTQPGMTNTSLVPDIARANGLSFRDLLSQAIQTHCFVLGL